MASPIVKVAYSAKELASMREARTHPMKMDSKGRLISKITGKQVWGCVRRPPKESLADYKARLKRLNLAL